MEGRSWPVSRLAATRTWREDGHKKGARAPELSDFEGLAEHSGWNCKHRESDIHIMPPAVPTLPSRMSRNNTVLLFVRHVDESSNDLKSRAHPARLRSTGLPETREDGVPSRARLGGVPAEGGRSGLRGQRDNLKPIALFSCSYRVFHLAVSLGRGQGVFE